MIPRFSGASTDTDTGKNANNFIASLPCFQEIFCDIPTPKIPGPESDITCVRYFQTLDPRSNQGLFGLLDPESTLSKYHFRDIIELPRPYSKITSDDVKRWEKAMSSKEKLDPEEVGDIPVVALTAEGSEAHQRVNLWVDEAFPQTQNRGLDLALMTVG